LARVLFISDSGGLGSEELKAFLETYGCEPTVTESNQVGKLRLEHYDLIFVDLFAYESLLSDFEPLSEVSRIVLVDHWPGDSGRALARDLGVCFVVRPITLPGSPRWPTATI
jgi:hypothetical protein